MLVPQTHVTDAYGEKAQSLLYPLQEKIASLARDLTDSFYECISDQDKTAEILKRLLPEQLARLKQRQAQYFHMLASDDLTYAVHVHEARKVGQAHCFQGIEISWLVESYGIYQAALQQLLKEHESDPDAREFLLHVFAQRFLKDLEAQTSSYKQVAMESASAFSRIDQEVMSTINLADFVRAALEVMGTLPGGVSVFFARVDNSGLLQIEQSYGEAAEQYHRAMEASQVPKISIDENIPAGRGPGGQAWRTGKIIVSDAWLVDSNKAPWRETGRRLGFRSSAALPLLDETGRTIAMLSLYSVWPGYFSTESIYGLLNHAQRVLSQGVQQRINAPIVPLREQQTYRALLNEHCVVIHYQPVINLNDGTLIKIEGLARLRHPDGELISPQRFLPAFGRDELLKLFEYGMTQMCRDLLKLQSLGIDTKIAINLPTDGLDDPRYEQAFFSLLKKYDLPPDRFQIEVLETQDAGERRAHHIAFIQRLQGAGVEIAQDDLGSGHSSLLRLDQYPFDEVKIDQGLVRGAIHNPKRAVEFILHLTRLAHAFRTRVTVEGLENTGMIEAAAICGADYGQGYGIAKPMPVDQLPHWHREYVFTVNPKKPTTAIGAMAAYLLWDMQLATIAEYPELVDQFVGNKAVVDQFVKVNELQATPIDQLITDSFESVTVDNVHSTAASDIRSKLIQALTDHWLSEAKT